LALSRRPVPHSLQATLTVTGAPPI
jgi:hypothetical protein